MRSALTSTKLCRPIRRVCPQQWTGLLETNARLDLSWLAGWGWLGSAVVGTGGRKGGRLSHITNVVFIIFLTQSIRIEWNYRSRSQTFKLFKFPQLKLMLYQFNHLGTIYLHNVSNQFSVVSIVLYISE